MALDFTDRAYDEGSDQGYYQHTLLTDIVDNFMLSETGEGMLLQNTSRNLVEYHAQRGIQELTYDTLQSVKSREYDPEGAGSIVLPQDGVGVLGVFWIDNSGYKHPMTERRFSGNPIATLEDADGEPLYDENGERLFAENSETLGSFNNRTQSVAADAFYNYYAGSFENDELYDRYYSYYGRRFGSDPVQTNINGSYIYDEDQAIIFVDSSYATQIIVVDYVSDGLGDDINKIRVHKFSEEAIYDYTKFKLVGSKTAMPLFEKQIAKKVFYSSKMRAKHRLSGLTPQKIWDAMRGKSKWIKH